MKKIMLIMTLLVATGAGATNYYIATTGSDSNPGTQISPWATINHADTVVVAGDTVHVAAGNYTFNPMQTNTSGTSGARIVYVSDTKWGAHITTNGWVENGDYVDITNFEITGVVNLANYGIIIAATGVHVLGNKIHDVPAPGCTSEGGAAIYNEANGAFQFSGNLIYNIGYPTNSAPCPRVHGIYLHEGQGGTISNNIIHSNIGWGIHVYNPNNEVVQNNFIVNNTIYGNFYGGILLAGGIPGTPDSGEFVANNIIQNNGRGSGASGYGIIEGSADPSNVGGYTGTQTYTDNLIYNNLPADLKLCTSIYTGCEAINTPTGTVNSDALLVSPYTDFHETVTSPSKDKGTSTNAPVVDFDGNSRPQGAAWDIGAYEFVVSATGPSAPTGLTATVQ